MPSKPKRFLSALLALAFTLGLLSGLPLTAFAAAADADVSGSYVTDHEDGTMTLVIKGVAPIDFMDEIDDSFMLMCTDGAYDFTGVTVTTTAPLTYGQGMNQINFWPSGSFTIPTTGLEITISGVVKNSFGGAGDELRLVFFGADGPNETIIPVFGGGGPGDADITLGLTVSNTTFSPDWEGNLPAAEQATVTVTAKDKNTGLTDATINGRVVLYTENGPITLLNGQSYLYADMIGGVGTATISKLTDAGALNSTYTVNLTAAMPLYDAQADAPVTLSVTPHPLSVSGTVFDDQGGAMADASVCLLTADGYMASRTVTDAAGHYLLYGSPKSSAYRVIAVKDDLYGEVTRDLLVQNTADIILYSQLKVTVNFYRNKATLDGSPNSNVVSPGNLYAANTYTTEAYADAAGTTAIAPVRTDGRDVYFQLADIIAAGGKLFLKAVPYSKYQDPFIDNSSLLTEVDYATALDPYNIALDLEETPVGTVTVRNTGTADPIYVQFRSGAGTIYNLDPVAIPPGGMYAYAPDEGYQTVADPMQVLVCKYAHVPIETYGEQLFAVVSKGRKTEFEMSADDIIGNLKPPQSYQASLYSEKQYYGDLVPLSIKIGHGNNLQLTVELPPTLELPSNWRDYVSLSSCQGSKTLFADQIDLEYDPVKNTISFACVDPFTLMARAGTWYTYYPIYRTEAYNAYAASLGDAFVSPFVNGYMIFNFTVKPKTAEVTAHRCVLTNTRGTAPGTNNAWYWWYFIYYRNVVNAHSFVTGHPLTLEVPATTNSDKVFVQGYAKPGAAVTISAEGYPGSLAAFTANQAGRYSGTVTLPNIEQSKDIKLAAASEGKTSNKETVRYSRRLLYTKELHLQSKQAGSFDKEYLLINNSVQTVDGAPVIVDAQAGKTQNIMLGDEIKFRVRMSDDSAVQKVFVSMETASGQSLGSIPCLLKGSGYWESETLDFTNGSRAAGFRVTYVLNLGHEYMSPQEIEANMRESEAALLNWTPPQRMTTDPEAYANELQQAMLDAMPPELRAANYTDLGGGKTRVNLDLGGQSVSFDQTLEQITGAELNALAGTALAKGLPLGSGNYYREIEYYCTLSGGGTRTMTQEEYDRVLYDLQRAHPSDSYEQLLANRMGIDALVMKTTEYMDQPVLGRAEGARNIVELGTAGAGAILSYPWAQLAPQWAGNTVGVVNTVVSSLGLPDKYFQSADARDVANSYEAMYDNFRSLQYTECFSKLNQDYKNVYANQLALMESNISETSRLKWTSYGNTASSTLTTVGSAGVTAVTFGGGALAKEGLQAFVGNILNAVGSSIGSFFNYEESFNFQLGYYKDSYNTIQHINNAFKEDMALACGQKESEKSQGNYNFIYDPQGVVYDGTLDYPVAGVRAELWTADDGDGTAARYWDEAEDYDQINPQITEDDGMFSWFTPEGWWQVRIFDDATGAELGRSEWLKVLPPHFGVNINIGGEPLTVTYDANGGGLPAPEIPDDFDDPDGGGFLFDPLRFPQTVFQVPRGKNHTAIANVFIRDGYTFAGWNTAANGSGTAYAAGAAVAGVQADVTLYAQWTTGTAVDPPKPPSGGNPPGETVTPTPPPLAGGWLNPYDDVADIDWFYDAVRFVTERELMEGTAANLFSPNTTLTRAMIVTILWRLEGKPEVTGDIPFPDVETGKWYSDAILWAGLNDIVFGYPNGTFGWNDPVTREQAVVILYRYAQAKGLDVSASADLSGFTDAGDISDWALDAMRWAVAAGIIQGRPGSKTAPQDTSTRAEIAMIFKRYIEDFLDAAGGEDGEPEE